MLKSESLSFLHNYPVIVSSQALQTWETQYAGLPAWVLVSPPFIPGLFLLQKAQFQDSALTALSDSIAQLLLSLQTGCPLTLLRGMLALMPQSPALLEQLLALQSLATPEPHAAPRETALPPLTLPTPEPVRLAASGQRSYLILLEDP